MDNKTNPRRAAALSYDPKTDSAPVLSAVGVGVVAENILNVAKAHGVPVVEDSSTAELLSRFSVGDVIPPLLYEAVAQILIFVAEMDAAAGADRKYTSLKK